MYAIRSYYDINRMMAEFLGKEIGYCKGKGGSMHIADLEGGNLGANGIVGGGIPLAVGRITSYNVCYTKLLRYVVPSLAQCDRRTFVQCNRNRA